jgi:hypothetical protein
VAAEAGTIDHNMHEQDIRNDRAKETTIKEFLKPIICRLFPS